LQLVPEELGVLHQPPPQLTRLSVATGEHPVTSSLPMQQVFLQVIEPYPRVEVVLAVLQQQMVQWRLRP
jgi:hypothetical protein